jgi:hypothetical protein
MAKYYVVMGIERKTEILVMGQEVGLPLEFADGMVGVLPVFNDLQSAEEYAGDNLTVMVIETLG